MAYDTPLLTALQQLYQPVRQAGIQQIKEQADLARQRAMEDIANRGIYQSGALAKYLAEKIGGQEQMALSGLESNIAQVQAQALANLYQQQQQQNFQREMAEQARKQQVQDFFRNTMLNLAGGLVNPMFKILGTQIGYKMAPDVYNLALLKAMQTSYGGRGTDDDTIIPPLPQ